MDVVKGILILAERQVEDRNIEGEYNFSPDYDDCIMTSDFVMMFCNEWGENLSSRYQYDSNYKDDRLKLRVDNSKSKNTLLWVPNWSPKEAVRRLVEWEKAVKNGANANLITDKQIVDYFSRTKTLKKACL